MNTIEYIAEIIVPAAARLLPAKMNSREAKAMLLTSGLQESRFVYRKQVGGPAHGFWQFEGGGGWRGVLTHSASATLAKEALKTLAYAEPSLEDYYAIQNNDILACVFARLLLWTHPKALPAQWQIDYAWEYYINLWRPGKPHRATWNAFYNQAWGMVT